MATACRPIIKAVGCSVSKEGLQHLGNQHRRTVKHETEKEVVSIGDGKIAFLQQADLDHGIRMAEFPNNRRN